jgi:uncharacterized integral membrane protein
MKILLNLIKIFIFMLALFILASNSTQYVTINLLNHTIPQVSLMAVILVSLTIGAVTGVIFMAFSVIQYQSEIKRLRNQNKQLKTELENLRNVSIDEIPEDTALLPAPTTTK